MPYVTPPALPPNVTQVGETIPQPALSVGYTFGGQSVAGPSVSADLPFTERISLYSTFIFSENSDALYINPALTYEVINKGAYTASLGAGLFFGESNQVNPTINANMAYRIDGGPVQVSLGTAYLFEADEVTLTPGIGWQF